MTAAADTLGSGAAALYGGGGGFSWWQAAGAMLVVLALLAVVLRLLARFQRPSGRGLAAVARVVPLGPRRELEVVRLRGRAHFVYRREGALVLLGDEPWEQYEAAESAEPPREPAWKRFLPRRED